MKAKVLDIGDGELTGLENIHGFRERRRVGIGKIRLRIQRLKKIPSGCGRQSEAGRDRRSPTQQWMTSPESMVIRHADACSSIPTDTNASNFTRSLSPIVLDELHPGAEALFCGSPSGERDLLVREIVRLHGNPVMPRHVKRERAPSASCLHHALAGLKPELPAHVIEFRNLRLFERRRWRGIIRAGIYQLSIQPQLVEIVSQIVVAMNVVAGAMQAVGLTPGPSNSM